MTMTPEEKQEFEALKAELAEAKEKSGLRVAMGHKKNVCVYGLQRFPVTLYAGSWLKLLEIAEEIEAFIAENHEELEWKGGDPFDRSNLDEQDQEVG